ncbi:uncharacterized protein LOC131697467 [Acipenser ruthenus]|uniref:uncharacterized protein LOC131697467 n=1 Tax=Acipenser ruthenus TaxID=7906 RepID=UPI0027414EB5|nr:uncharacterized protein LOC131697467 [Acipenser ruthenus]
MEKRSAYAFPSDSDEFLPPTPPPVRLCQASHSSSRSMTAPAPPVNLASTRSSARQERGSKRGSASQPPPQLHYKDWTTPKLLKILFEKSIPIPVGGDRMSLFLTYCEALSAEPIFPPRLQASAVRPSSPATFSVPVHAAHAQDPALAAQLPLPAQSTQPQHLPPQSLTPPVPSSSSAPQVTFNQLQSLLQPIIDSQLALSARLDKLENPSSAPPAFSSSTPAYTFGTSSSVPPAALPEFNLSSATVASSSSPRAITSHSISPKIRKLIIEGKDVNLVSILIASSEFLDHRVVDCGDVSVTLKSRDPRLQKSLSVGEFVLAFSVYRDILCSVYPHRLQELNQYLFLVVELSVRYGGTLFYQYHRAFSAKAAATLSADNRIVDWSRSDPDLFTRIFSGIRANACSACASTAHSSYLCPKNLRSAITEPEVVSSLLQAEVDKGFMVGPFAAPPFTTFRINPIGIATRKYSGKKRLIIDLSAPRGGYTRSINSLISSEEFALHYIKLSDAIYFIKIAGHGAWLAKADISDAFKVMPIHPSLRHLFGVCWADKFYFSTQLTFGCRSSPKIFDSLSEALSWILLNSYHVPFLLHLMDDFLLISPPLDPPAQAINQLKTLFSLVGVPLSQEKTIGPVNSLEFLGITLNTVKFEASLPPAKLQRLLSLINSFQISSFIKKRDLLSLLGHFNFAIRIIPQGRTFISRLLALSSTVRNMNSHVKISADARKDIKMWINLLTNWNGLSLFYDDFISAPHDLALFTDASSIGFGGFLAPEWFSSTWPSEIQFLPPQEKSTALLEIYPIVVGAVLWGHQWSRKSILFFSDNKPTVHIINKGRSSSPLIMRLLRRLIWSFVSLNFLIQARHLPGIHNNAADALSRLQVSKFRQLVPSASPSPLQIPQFHQLLLD